MSAYIHMFFFILISIHIQLLMYVKYILFKYSSFLLHFLIFSDASFIQEYKTYCYNP